MIIGTIILLGTIQHSVNLLCYQVFGISWLFFIMFVFVFGCILFYACLNFNKFKSLEKFEMDEVLHVLSIQF